MLLVTPAVMRAAEEGVDAPAQGLGMVDGIIIALYALLLVGIGLYYSRRQTSQEEYFVGGRSVSPFLAGISLYATMFSALSYIGYPGEIIQNGPVLIGVGVAAIPLVYLIVGYGVIPLMMRLPVTSAYELLEKRLGPNVRLLGSGIFVVTRLIWMAVMLHLTSFVMVSVMGWEASWAPPIAIVAGILTTVYTVTGGLRAVVVSDVVQFFVLLIGALFTLWFISDAVGGWRGWWPQAWEAHWKPQPFFSLDPGVRVTVVGTFVGGIIWWVCTAGSDQMAIQRYLSTRDTKAARRAFLHNCIGAICVTSTLGLMGLAVLGYYRSNPEFMPANLSFATRGDAMFPHFVAHHLPLGMPGLITAGLMAAAMSSLSSGISSTITVISKDFVDQFRPTAAEDDKAGMRTARLLAVIVGGVSIAGSQLAGAIPGNLIEVAGKSINLFVCPLFGLFFLALFVPFATPFGAIMGTCYSLAAATLIAYWEFFTGLAPVSFQWIAPVSLVVALAAGPLFSLLPTRGKSPRLKAIYAGLATLPWLGLMAWLG